MKPRLLELTAVLICFLFGSVASQGRIPPPTPIVREPTGLDELRLFHLWKDVCDNGRAEQGRDGDDFVFCALVKNPPKPTIINHPAIHLDGARATKGNQIIVIDPPYYDYRHRFVLQGDRASPHKTTIFVRPPKHRHQVDLEDHTTAEGKPQKPTIVYFKPEENQTNEGDHQPQPVHPDRRSLGSDTTPPLEEATMTRPVVQDAPEAEAAPVPKEEVKEVNSPEKSVIRTARTPLPLPLPLARQEQEITYGRVAGVASGMSTVFFQMGSSPGMRFTIGY